MHKKKNEAPQRPSVVTQLYRINTKTRMHVRILTGALYEIKHYVLNIFMCLQPRGTSVGWNMDVNAATLYQLELFEPDK